MKLASKIEILESIPPNVLPESSNVDLLHFVALNKICIRTRISNRASYNEVENWCSRNSYYSYIDTNNFLFIVKDKSNLKYLYNLDTDEQPHEFRLGSLLGYPKCCCLFIEKVGESNIDSTCSEVEKWGYLKEFILINPHGYTKGNSLICHIPCSPNCQPSLELALQALAFIRLNENSMFTRRWRDWLTLPVG